MQQMKLLTREQTIVVLLTRQCALQVEDLRAQEPKEDADAVEEPPC